jgi:hypothetical protein
VPNPLRDVVDCNEYANWVIARAAHVDRIAAQGATDSATEDERFGSGALTTVGTLEGLSNPDDPRAVTAYRQCMLRRGYNVWG